MQRAYAFSSLLQTCLVLLSLPSLQSANAPSPAQPQHAAQTAAQIDAQAALNRGVEAFKNGQPREAEQFFARAKALDPNFLNARLYLATTYASQYIAGLTSEENLNLGHQAIEEFTGVLALDPKNLPAIDGIGSLLFQMAAGEPFQPPLFQESKRYHQRHIQLSPEDPEPYYWIGVIDWTLAFRANGEMRTRFNNEVSKLDEAAPLPPELRHQYEQQYGPTIEEGIESMNQAIKLKPDYDDAMTYLSLLYRRKADITADETEREKLLKLADALIDKVKEIKQRRAEAPRPS
jgi:tetratricopeptide (TPR) repeat protein